MALLFNKSQLSTSTQNYYSYRINQSITVANSLTIPNIITITVTIYVTVIVAITSNITIIFDTYVNISNRSNPMKAKSTIFCIILGNRDKGQGI